MRALWYGRKKNPRAPHGASTLLMSSEKNQTPGTPSWCTYVRTFSSRNELRPGTAGVKKGRTPHILNGTTPTHAWPSNVSIERLGGMSGRRAAGATGQCMKRSLPHHWRMSGRPRGRLRIESRSIEFLVMPRLKFSGRVCRWRALAYGQGLFNLERRAGLIQHGGTKNTEGARRFEI